MLVDRVQITTDGHRAYLEAVEGAFGGDVDYAQVNLLFRLGDATTLEQHKRLLELWRLGFRISN